MVLLRFRGVKVARSRGKNIQDSGMLKNFKELKVWQKAYSLCVEIYKITQNFPNVEKYGLCSQMRRSSVSIPSNIARNNFVQHTLYEVIRMLSQLQQIKANFFSLIRSPVWVLLGIVLIFINTKQKHFNASFFCFFQFLTLSRQYTFSQ